MADQSVKLFLSCVSDEFGAYRDELRRKLTRPNVEVKIQQDFKALGGDTLSMLEEYIERCDAVVHFAGDMTGSAPKDFGVAELLVRRPDLKARLPPLGAALDAGAKISYTQWEAWLAVYFRKDLVVAAPAPGVARDPNFAATKDSEEAQAAHLARLREIGRYPEVRFTDKNDLVGQIFASAVIKALVKADRTAPPRQPRNLPFASLGSLFVGRNADLNRLRAALATGKEAAVVGRALHGLGGVGKTRLAIEYALRHETDYSALLLVRADNPATLAANLAAFAGAEVLDLPEKDAPQDAAKIEAALRWLEAHPTWLMILDNVDDEKAVAAVSKLMTRLKGGHVIATARASNFPASVRKLELDVLDEDSAMEFLLERTADDRDKATDDQQRARELAHELGGLALGLEQAGAYIATERIGFARYLTLWRDSRQKVVAWFDRTLMSYDHDTGLAATWATSVDRLTHESRRLLDRLAMLAPDPIPDSLLDVAVPGEAADYDAHRARVGLYAYSLITRASGEDGSAMGFVVHRLVQDFARRAMTKARRCEALREALAWVNEASVGDAEDVRSWPVLDPLAPHALAVARKADDAALAEPTGWLFHQFGSLFHAKARYSEAEPLMRRAIEISELRCGPDDPAVSTCIGNLALLLGDTNRVREVEPLLRRALAIDEVRFGPNNPKVAIRLSNLGELLRDTNRLDEAEHHIRRALAIDEASLGPDHANVAIRLNNLAGLLEQTNRRAEAEPLYRRALTIFDESHGANHPRTAAGLNNLASLLQATQRLAEAESLYRRALRIDEASYGPDHPNVAIRLANLATVLGQTNRPVEAEPLLRRALKIDESAYGPDHPNVGIRLANLAGLLRGADRLSEAEPLYRRALAIFENSLGSDHPNTVTVRSSLAALEAARDRGM